MPKNVKEHEILVDTVVCSKFVRTMSDPPDGWFGSFSDMGSAREYSFFNRRNKSIGYNWNNQDSRDAMPYGMRVSSLAVDFISPACASQLTACESDNDQYTPYPDDATEDPNSLQLLNREELHGAVWSADLPNHASLTLQINQDIRLKSNVTMLPSGIGAIGSGWGWGSPGTWQSPYPAIGAVPGMFQGSILGGTAVSNLQTINAGSSDIRQRFEFPIAIDIPKRANVSAVVKFSRYGRDMLQSINGPYWIQVPGGQVTDIGILKRVKSALFAIQVSMEGERLTQQRGEYHV